MVEHLNSPMVLRSRAANVFLARFWIPLLLAGPAIGIIAQDFPTWRIVFASPFFLGILFQVSIAVLELRGGVLRYKRFFNWTTIHEHEIVAAGVSWHPAVGYVRLNRYVFPWGRLYFVLDRNTEWKPFRPGRFALVQYLNRGGPDEGAQSSVPSSVAESPYARLFIAAVIGVLASLVTLYIAPGNLLLGGLPPATSSMPIPLKALFHFSAGLHTTVVQVTGLVLIAFMAVHRRDRPEAWAYAFLSGFVFTLMIVGRLLF